MEIVQIPKKDKTKRLHLFMPHLHKALQIYVFLSEITAFVGWFCLNNRVLRNLLGRIKKTFAVIPCKFVPQFPKTFNLIR